MIRAAITGGLACGKSTVLEMFGQHPHVKTLSADKVVHELYKPGQPVHARVAAEFGKDILDPGGRIDRKKLAQVAFGALPLLRKLESIVHPAVMEYEVAWMDSIEQSEPETLLAIIEVPLLFESKSDTRFARTIAVTTDPKKKLARFRARHPELTEAEAQAELERRSASQLADAEKASRAGLVIDNSGTLEETRIQVKKIYDELTRPG